MKQNNPTGLLGHFLKSTPEMASPDPPDPKSSRIFRGFSRILPVLSNSTYQLNTPRSNLQLLIMAPGKRWGSGGPFSLHFLTKRLARKLRRIILLHSKLLMTFRFHFGKIQEWCSDLADLTMTLNTNSTYPWGYQDTPNNTRINPESL